MQEFLTWEQLGEFVTFVGVLFTIVEVTKELPRNKENTNKTI